MINSSQGQYLAWSFTLQRVQGISRFCRDAGYLLSCFAQHLGLQLTLAYWLCSVLQGNGSRWEVSQRIMTIWMTHHDYSKLESTTCPFLLRNPKLIGGTMCICVSGLWGAHRSRSKYRVRNYRVEAVSQSSVPNQHPKVRISVAESASKPILDQHRNIVDKWSGAVGIGRDGRDGRGSPRSCDIYPPDPSNADFDPATPISPI